MTATTVREQLEAERRVTVQRLAGLTGSFDDVVAAAQDANGDDEHDPEGATVAFDRAQIVALVRQAREHVAEVDAALDRLADGTYGTCERCGRAIAPARLEARPAARTCIACAASA